MKCNKNLFILLGMIFLVACSSEKAKNQVSDAKTFSRSIDTLQKFINLDTYKPVNVMWKVVQQGEENKNREMVPGPTDYVLQAFIQLDRETADRLKNNFIASFEIISTDIYWFDWLPKDLKLKDKLDSSHVYNAGPFTKSPLLNGKYIFVNGNTILIELFTS